MFARLTPDEARRILRYDPNTGKLTWKITANNNRAMAGAEAGCFSQRDQRMLVGYEGRLYQATHIIWLIVYGKYPANEVDHVNMVAWDNRLSNLREATHSQNAMNRITRIDNTTGYTGIRWQSGKWRWYINHNGKRIAGKHSTKEEAIIARQSKARELFGEFSP